MYFNQSVALSTMNSTAGYSVIVVALIGLSLIFFSLHFLGFNTMPRRYVDYSDNLQLHNQIATMFLMSFLLAPAISLLMFPMSCSALFGTVFNGNVTMASSCVSLTASSSVSCVCS